MEYFLSNKLFSTIQYGFIKGLSNVLQLLNILDDWSVLFESCRQIDVIYTDFEKAFDKIPHNRLMYKLKLYGLSEKLLLWIHAFLCFRTQRVRVNGAFSSIQPVLSGIP